ncbi:27226_t:CDS:1 [Dentiscutata erythropus]|uniref:27226_t:CDS:1 n=1 Tax=Dentiscutata erythropus TaxID=1348616 RepID=A0A9N9PHY6_9GLOM|nr:27226_t:CDS:1 [Dentiscutata erythropus]
MENADVEDDGIETGNMEAINHDNEIENVYIIEDDENEIEDETIMRMR